MRLDFRRRVPGTARTQCGRADLKHLRAMTEAEIRKGDAAGTREPAARFLEGRRTRQAKSTTKTEALASPMALFSAYR
jgi:hypothetical protein